MDVSSDIIYIYILYIILESRGRKQIKSLVRHAPLGFFHSSVFDYGRMPIVRFYVDYVGCALLVSDHTRGASIALLLPTGSPSQLLSFVVVS